MKTKKRTNTFKRPFDLLVMWFLPKYYIRIELMGGTDYYMIYIKQMCINSFYERWNTLESAKTRLDELNT